MSDGKLGTLGTLGVVEGMFASRKEGGSGGNVVGTDGATGGVGEGVGAVAVLGAGAGAVEEEGTVCTADGIGALSVVTGLVAEGIAAPTDPGIISV